MQEPTKGQSHEQYSPPRLRNLLLAGAVLLTLVLPLVPVIPDDNSTVAASTYYDTKWWSLWSIRDKITTSLVSTRTVNGARSTVLKAENKTSNTQSWSYSYANTKSGEVSLGATVPIKAIELEAGVKVSYSTTTTVSASVNVPGKTTYIVYKRQDSKIRKYKNIVQKQARYTDGSWRNDGDSRTVYSEWKESYPTITISK